MSMNKNIVGIIILLFLCVGCKKDENIESPQEIGKKIYAYTTDKGSRTYFEEQGNYMVHKWQTDDCIGVFDKTTAVSEYLLIDGADSEEGVFLQMTMPEGGNSLNQAYAIYPLAENNKITAEGVFRVVYPETQTYSSEHTASYGNGSNILVAASASSESFSFKNACGFLEVQLCGEGITVKNIVLSGNKSERIAGDAVVAYKGTSDPKTTMLSTAKTSITLDCGDGVQLDESLPTSFVFALPPTNFSEGFLIRVTDTDGKFFEKRTDKKIDLVRNAVQPMSSIACKMTIPTNQIWYKSSNAITPTNVGTILTNEYDSTKEYWVITLEQSLTTVGDLAFKDNASLQSILLPNSVTEMGRYAFSGCTSLTSVTIHDSVTKIGNIAFDGCTSLMDIYVNITSMAAYATKNTMYYIPGNKHLLVDSKEITDLVIPDSVTSIGNDAFNGCTSLTSVTIPESVTEIGCHAFYDCTGELIINNKIVETDYSSFDNEWIRGSKFYKITIGKGITKIGKNAFSDCYSLTSITIPDSVTSIGGSAFYDCTGELIINSKIVETDYSYNYNSDSATNYWLDGSKFYKITIGKGITKIGDYAFYGCTSLKEVDCRPTTPPEGGRDMFSKNNDGSKLPIGCMIYVPASDDDGTINAYKTQKCWSRYASYIVE